MPDDTLQPILPDAALPVAAGVLHAGLLHLSGHVGFAPGTSEPIAGGLDAQTHETLRRLDAAMAEAGASREGIVSMRIHLADVRRDFARMNELFAAWIGSHRCARTTVGSTLAVEGLLIEIDAVVALPTPR